MFRQFTEPRRVVITGMGCVTPLGIGREKFWAALTAGESGVRKIERFDVSSSPVKIAAEVPDFDWEAQLNPKDRKHVPRTVPLALAAAREAVEDAALQTKDFSLEQRRSEGVGKMELLDSEASLPNNGWLFLFGVRKELNYRRNVSIN